MKEKEKISSTKAPFLILYAFIALAALKVAALTGAAGGNDYLGIIVLQLLIFLIPAAVFLKLSGKAGKGKFRIRFIGAKQILLSILGAFVLITGSLLISIFFTSESSSGILTYNITNGGSVEEIISITLAYAALPAVCEEFFFRSVICSEYEREGVLTALAVSSLFFSMSHFSLVHFPIYLFAGSVLFLTLYGTRSIAGPIIVHFLFNMYGLFGHRFIGELYGTTGSPELFLLLLASLFLLSCALFCGEASSLYGRYSQKNKESDYAVYREKGETKIIPSRRRRGNLARALLSPPLLVCYLIFILAIVLI